MSPEEVRSIAEDVAKVVASEAAEKAVKATLTALGVNVERLTDEQKVWAFARTMQQGTHRGVMALFTGFLTAFATTIAGAVWYFFYKPPHS